MSKIPKMVARRNSRTCAPSAAVPAYAPTQAEQIAIMRMADRVSHRAPPPRSKVTASAGVVSIDTAHADKTVGATLIFDVLATDDEALARGLVSQLVDVGRERQEITASELDFMLSIVRGIGAKDETEALLAVQMAAIHNATMTAAGRLKNSQTPLQQDSASTILNKLARTFSAQVETLKKYRSTGEQSIRVQHVTVNEGGQAIVAGKMQGGVGGPRLKTERQSHEPCTAYERGTEVPRNIEANGATLSCSSGSGKKGLPLSRC